jgi:rhodanese-related sulfurtransferase
MLKKISIFLYFFLLTVIVSQNGCVQQKNVAVQNDAVQTVNAERVYSGKVSGISGKKHTLSLLVRHNDTPRDLSFVFNDTTRGIGHAVKGKYILVTAIKSDGGLLATHIKPNFSGLMEGVSEINVNDVKNKINNRKDFVLIDSRTSAAYMKAHLPTAISLPACSMADHLNILPDNKQRLLVFYCDNSTCGSSIMASAIATESGYKKIKVLKAGLKGWIEDNNKTVASDSIVQNNNVVLVDLRSAKDFSSKRIDHAVSIPFETLASRSQELSVLVPVVVYSDSIQESLNALTLLRNKKFQNVSMIDGNLQGWKKRGNKLQTDSTFSQTIPKRQPGPGEVSVQEFRNAMTGLANAQILDVRTDKEVKAGKIQGALHIPLNEIINRMGELTRTKKVYIYCLGGARADMARRFLKGQGFDAYFLLAHINCSGGKCVINE